VTGDTQAANGGGSLGWSAFLRYLVVSAMVLALLLYAFILVLDPYQNVPFSPSLPRAPVAQNQRFSYPALARDGVFEGLVLGTSTLRLTDPAALGAGLGVPFFNLSMNSATAHEQHELGRLALRHHAHLRYLVIGVDEVWCSRREDLADYTFRAFPAWMYDEDRWNDLPYLFNDKALEDALRMLELLAGWRAPKYGRDGTTISPPTFPSTMPPPCASASTPGPAAAPQLRPARCCPPSRVRAGASRPSTRWTPCLRPYRPGPASCSCYRRCTQATSRGARRPSPSARGVSPPASRPTRACADWTTCSSRP